jgi:hypothetical protein
MTLTFTEGSERPWTFNMIGSKEVSAAFARCIIATDKPVTQPFGQTQPFGKQQPPAPTQPVQPAGRGSI